MKKYKYSVSLNAEGNSWGYVDLTEEQAKIVAYATNADNWQCLHSEHHSGYFNIDIDNPVEISETEQK